MERGDESECGEFEAVDWHLVVRRKDGSDGRPGYACANNNNNTTTTTTNTTTTNTATKTTRVGEEGESKEGGAELERRMSSSR